MVSFAVQVVTLSSASVDILACSAFNARALCHNMVALGVSLSSSVVMRMPCVKAATASNSAISPQIICTQQRTNGLASAPQCVKRAAR
ncbi:hypothetical protein BDV12DRAFT_175793 [Aspergillus spectabilis]